MRTLPLLFYRLVGIVAGFAIVPSIASAQIARGTVPTRPAYSTSRTAIEAKTKRCSANADAKGLHGKERKKFLHACKQAQR